MSLHLNEIMDARNPNAVILTKVEKVREDEELVSQAQRDLEQLVKLENEVSKVKQEDQDALAVAEAALESIAYRYPATSQETSLESSQDESLKARVLTNIREAIKRVAQFIIDLLKKLFNYSSELIKTSETRRRIIKSRIKAMLSTLKEDKDLTLIPVSVNGPSAAMIALDKELDNSYITFMGDMSSSIKSFLRSPVLRLTKEIFGIYANISDVSQRDRFILQRLNQIKDFEWVNSSTATKAKRVIREDHGPVISFKTATYLPNNKRVTFHNLPTINEQSISNASYIGYSIRERKTDLTDTGSTHYFDQTDPSKLTEELKSLDQLVDSLNDLMDHIKRESPQLEKASKQYARFKDMLDRHVEPSEESIMHMRVFNAAINNLLSFPTQFFHALMSFVTAYTSLLTAVMNHKTS